MCECIDFSLWAYFKRAFLTIRGDAISIVRVVVVERTRSVDVANVVRVADVRGTQPPIKAFYNYCPMLSLSCFSISAFRQFLIMVCTSYIKRVQYSTLAVSRLYVL